jgi:hypothetical protein
MTEILYKVLKKIYYDYLPNSLRKYYGPEVDILYARLHRLYSMVCDLSMPVTCMIDQTSHVSFKHTIVVASIDTDSCDILNRSILPETTTTNRVSLGKRYLWNVSKLNKGKTNTLLIEADRCFFSLLKAKGLIAIPTRVMFTLDITMPTEDILKRYKKRNWSNYQRIVKCDCTYEVVRDRDMVELFYYRMYLPYITSRHREAAITLSFEYINNLMQYGELLLIKKGNEYIGGILINTSYSPPLVAFLGILDAREDYFKIGLSPIMYNSVICWAKEKGHTTLDFGHCMPFLDDSLLQFKRQWGMTVRRSPRAERTLYLSLGRVNASLKQYLINHPLICEDHGHLKGLLSLDRNATHTDRAVEALKKKYTMPGLNEFSVILL